MRRNTYTITHKVCNGQVMRGETDRSDLFYALIPNCYFCRQGADDVVVMPKQSYEEWIGDGPNRYIQNAFHFYTPDHRDFIKIGVHPACMDKAMQAAKDAEGGE